MLEVCVIYPLVVEANKAVTPRLANIRSFLVVQEVKLPQVTKLLNQLQQSEPVNLHTELDSFY